MNRSPEDFLDEQVRMKALNRSIDSEFGHLAPDEIEILAAAFDEAFADMFEVVRVGKRKSTFEIFSTLDEPYKVTIPLPILAHLKKRDVFWAILGRRENDWNLVYLSPHYLSGADVEKWANQNFAEDSE